MTEWIVNDGPEDHCFGCGQRNEGGLRLKFLRTGETSVETEYQAPDVYNGAPGVLHGGIQAALLDEVMGIVAHLVAGPQIRVVTADFRLRYRRTTPTREALTVRGRLVREDGPQLFLEGEILDPEGQVLTEAEARWRRFS